MTDKLTYEELERRVKDLEEDAAMHRQTEAELRASEQKYRTLLNNAAVPISFWEFQGTQWRLALLNAVAARDLGGMPEELVGKTLDDIFPDRVIADIFNQRFKPISELGVGGQFEEGIELKTGKMRWFRSDVQPVKAPGGSVIAIQVLSEDITDRKRAEEALRESESKFRNLFDLSPQPIILTEIETGKLIEVNDKLCELTQYAREQIVGRTTTEVGFYSEESRKKFIHELKRSGEISGLEIDYNTRDGSMLNALAFSRIIQIKGESFILTIFLVVTEQKRLEAQLQQAHKMEAIGTLAGGIAHDFNNILMGIQGRTSLMLMEKDSSHSDYEHLKGIEDYIKSAADLTKQLLGFARGGKYEVKPTDINELIKKQNRMFGRTKKEIMIRGKYEKDLWAADTDRVQVEQVILNLYVNAWQAMPAGGNLYVQTENVIIDEYYPKRFKADPGKYVKISITDSGVGMDEATRQKIFDPFFTTKEMGRGTGLGLASVYGIIKNHGGFINVYSEKGEGTTFTIYLPASEGEVEKPKDLSTEILKGTETVLFVDDEEMIVEVGEELLDSLGYSVITARSGIEAVEIYRENKGRIDMVILDMVMPGMGGGETYDLLKKIDPDIKVLLSSGFSINGQATKILNRGCDSFIQKPFDLKDLSQKLREVLNR